MLTTNQPSPFDLAQKVLKQVKEIISKGSTNKINHSGYSLAIHDWVLFIQTFVKSLWDNLFSYVGNDANKIYLEELITDEHIQFFLEYAALGVLARAFKCGNCTEQTALGLMLLLKQIGKDEKIEIVRIAEIEGKAHSGEKTHCFIIINRAKNSDITNPNTYFEEKNVSSTSCPSQLPIILDIWGDKCYLFGQKQLSDLEKHFKETINFSSGKIEIEVTYSHQAFKKEDLYYLLIFLQILEKICEKKETIEFLKKNVFGGKEPVKVEGMPDSVEKACKNIKNIVEQEINEYKNYVEKILRVKYSMKNTTSNSSQGTLFSNEFSLEKCLRNAVNSNQILDAQLCLLLGVDINAQDSNPEIKRTALHWAVIKKHSECIKLLVYWGARTDIIDAQGKKAAQYAEENSLTSHLLSSTAQSPTRRV